MNSAHLVFWAIPTDIIFGHRVRFLGEHILYTHTHTHVGHSSQNRVNKMKKKNIYTNKTARHPSATGLPLVFLL